MTAVSWGEIHWLPRSTVWRMRAWECCECQVLWRGPTSCWNCGEDGQEPTDPQALLAM
jgi:hypothetical protein